MKTGTRRQHPLHRQAGQGMAEYIIIVALVAVAGLATWELVGSSIGQSAAGVASAIAGTDANVIRSRAQGLATDAANQAAETENLSNYADDNGDGAGANTPF